MTNNDISGLTQITNTKLNELTQAIQQLVTAVANQPPQEVNPVTLEGKLEGVPFTVVVNTQTKTVEGQVEPVVAPVVVEPVVAPVVVEPVVEPVVTAPEPVVVEPVTTQNTVVLNNQQPNKISNYPLQIGRAFVSGEIKSGSVPALQYNNTVLQTQADIKNRWPDGSVKFAILTAVIPELLPNTKQTVHIVSQMPVSGGNSDANRLLDPALDFDVTLKFSGNITSTVSVRDMISANKYSVWSTGVVSTTWIFADHETKQFDVGTDTNCNIRPVIHVQLWEALKCYRVRVIFENSDTSKLQSQNYSVTITSGLNATQQYVSDTLTHCVGGRWTHEFWHNTLIPVVGINHNLNYLKQTQLLPNYDTSITLDPKTESNYVTRWNSSKTKKPFGIPADNTWESGTCGFWNKTMPMTGGRGDIGLFPDWHVAALYSDNGELQNVVKLNADLAGAWGMCFRTGQPNKTFDKNNSVAALGRVVTRDSHPTMFLFDNNQYMNSWAAAADRWTVLTPTANPNGWSHDCSHQPDPWYISYLLTGDYWYLEQLQFWASWGLFITNTGNSAWASGRSGSDAVIQDQIRGQAWCLRTRARCGIISPDGSPERQYFMRTTEQALRFWEGKLISTGKDPIRAWWATNYPLVPNPQTDNPLRFWGKGVNAANPPVDDVSTSEAPWMNFMLLQTLGHVKELGYSSDELIAWWAPGWIDLVNNHDARHLADYRIPVLKNTGELYKSWTDVFDGWKNWVSNWDNNLNDLTHGYSIFAIAAYSYLKDQPGGDKAWDWIYTNGYLKANWKTNPKMAILPR